MNRRKRKFIPTGSPVRTREIILVLLLAILAGVSIYISSGNSSALGLLSQPSKRQFAEVVSHFPTEIVSDPALLVLDTESVPIAQPTQTEAELIDPRVPPAVENLSVLNDNTGTQVIVSWTRPQFSVSLYVNVYRSEGEGKQKLVAEHIDANVWSDVDVAVGKTYTYVVRTAVSDNGVWYESIETQPETVVVTDVLRPLAPTAVSVSSTTTDAGKPGLLIHWIHPERAQSVRVYRSDAYGTRGTLIATILTSEISEYIDTAIRANTTYWYTVVSVDAAGNVSSDDFSVPTPGNNSPFDYLKLNQ